MNKPKFRAWDKNEEKWIGIKHLGYYDDGELWYLQSQDDNGVDCDPPYFEDDLGVSWDLMQYTGLKDKNGVEIYEGDIVKTVAGNIQVVVFVIGSKTNVQDSRIAQFNCYDNRGYFHFDQNDEVIGNIHENPELLSGVE